MQLPEASALIGLTRPVHLQFVELFLAAGSFACRCMSMQALQSQPRQLQFEQSGLKAEVLSDVSKPLVADEPATATWPYRVLKTCSKAPRPEACARAPFC